MGFLMPSQSKVDIGLIMPSLAQSLTWVFNAIAGPQLDMGYLMCTTITVRAAQTKARPTAAFVLFSIFLRHVCLLIVSAPVRGVVLEPAPYFRSAVVVQHGSTGTHSLGEHVGQCQATAMLNCRCMRTYVWEVIDSVCVCVCVWVTVSVSVCMCCAHVIACNFSPSRRFLYLRKQKDVHRY